LGRCEFLADRHQAWHLGFGDGDFPAAPVGERKVGYVKVLLGFEYGAHLARSLAWFKEFASAVAL
jgi:hypothetical protein